MYTQEEDSDEGVPLKSKSTPAKVKMPPKSQPTASSRGKDFTFLTAAEQRTQEKKDEKKAAESPYVFLEDPMDVRLHSWQYVF
jgi:DNA mismatch repair protein MSH6